MDDSYELLDAGGERRLERFGARVVDRPAPGEITSPLNPGAWRSADLRFDRPGGWQGAAASMEPWLVEVDGLSMELRPTGTGQVGLFPEHRASLGWLREQVGGSARAEPVRDGPVRDGPVRDEPPWDEPVAATPPPSVLNLFAYTGLATLSLAAAGAAVVHVDASRPAVAWARQNAGLSGLAERPIRWIVDDAEAFVARELRRGRRYDGIVLDPPSWGHGDDGRAWRLEERLGDLLVACAALSAGRQAFCLLTGHTPGLEPDRLAGLLARAFHRRSATIEAGAMELVAASGALLELGVFARLAR